VIPLDRSSAGRARADQKDEDSPPYAVLDAPRALSSALRQRDHRRGLIAETVRRVVRMVDINEHKRRRADRRAHHAQAFAATVTPGHLGLGAGIERGPDLSGHSSDADICPDKERVKPAIRFTMPGALSGVVDGACSRSWPVTK
jgi:hypothetical protein